MPEYSTRQGGRIWRLRRGRLSVDQVHAIPRGADAELWSPVERAVLAATDQLVEHQRVDDDTWALLAQHFDGPQLLEVLFVAGTYVCFAMVCNSAGLQPDPPASGSKRPSYPTRQPNCAATSISPKPYSLSSTRSLSDPQSGLGALDRGCAGSDFGSERREQLLRPEQ